MGPSEFPIRLQSLLIKLKISDPLLGLESGHRQRSGGLDCRTNFAKEPANTTVIHQLQSQKAAKSSKTALFWWIPAQLDTGLSE
jgi:hypothetical protein